MRKVFLTTFCIFMMSSVQAEITGVSSKTSLLQQLQISLNIPINQMRIPETLVSKFPVTNELTEIKPSFLAAWTQATFVSCKRAIERNQIPQLENPTEIKKWIETFSTTSWGMKANADETQSLYGAAFTNNENETPIHKMSLLCSLIMSSPKVYLIHGGN